MKTEPFLPNRTSRIRNLFRNLFFILMILLFLLFFFFLIVDIPSYQASISFVIFSFVLSFGPTSGERGSTLLLTLPLLFNNY